MDEPVVWQPQAPQTTRMWQFMRFVEQSRSQCFEDYQALHTWSIQQPSLFWESLCNFFDVSFQHPPDQVLNNENDMLNARWFEGATFNFAAMLLSRDDDHLAVIGIDERGRRQTLTYHELKIQVAQCAEGLKQAGITTGDRVAAILPNSPCAIIAMLATASIGAIWSSCSPDFGISAVLDRLSQIEPKVLFICDGYDYQGKSFDVLIKAQQLSLQLPSLTHLVVYPFSQDVVDLTHLPKAQRWDDFLKSTSHLQLTPFPFAHPLYILFSSGTTGKPKCIVHGAGGTLLQHIKELGLHTDIQPHDNVLFYTTCGWMMWNWMVSTLALGATLTLYDGAPMYPAHNRLFQLIEQEGVTVFGTSAKYISALEKSGSRPNTIDDLSSLRCILSTGSPLLPKNYDFVYEHIKNNVQLSSISGGTDIISCFALGNPILPVIRGELQCLGLGMSVDIYDEDGLSVRETRGELVCTKPFPSMPIGFWNDPDNRLYKHAYFDRFPGVWAHSDFAEITTHHGLIIYGRSDAVLNPGGVRIGTAEIYRQIEAIPEIVDSVVIGQNWGDDVRVVLFVKLQDNLQLNPTLIAHIKHVIRSNATPRHVPAKILQVLDIPRTMSGKIVELAVRQAVHGQPINNLESLSNPDALVYFRHREELLS